jgi:hypothetical protein
MAGRQTLDLSIGVRIPVPQLGHFLVNGLWLMVQKGSVGVQPAEPWKNQFILIVQRKSKTLIDWTLGSIFC